MEKERTREGKGHSRERKRESKSMERTREPNVGKNVNKVGEAIMLSYEKWIWQKSVWSKEGMRYIDLVYGKNENSYLWEGRKSQKERRTGQEGSQDEHGSYDRNASGAGSVVVGGGARSCVLVVAVGRRVGCGGSSHRTRKRRSRSGT